MDHSLVMVKGLAKLDEAMSHAVQGHHANRKGKSESSDILFWGSKLTADVTATMK